MTKEKIIHKGKKLFKTVKKNGQISYSQKGAYLGVDAKTGQKVTTTITGRTLKEFDRNLRDAQREFEEHGNTKKEKIEINNFKDLAEAWFASYHHLVSSENTLNRVRGYLDNYIIPKFGDYKPEMIDSSDVQLWTNKLASYAKENVNNDGYSEKGKAQDYSAVIHKLSDIFDFGITNFGLKKNPASTIQIPPRPRMNRNRVKVLHEEELKQWLAFLNELPKTRTNIRFKLVCDTLLASGLRINELLALTIKDVSLEESEIHVNKTLMWKANDKRLGTKGRVVCKPSPKSEAGNRKVPVDTEIVKRLIEWHDYMAEYFRKHKLPETDLLFPTIFGTPMCDRNERQTLKKRLEAANLPNYGFHIFRHTHASLLLNAGANRKEIQVRLGHKSISTTMDMYAELAPRRKIEAVRMIQQEIGKLTA